jgi:pimeloyl-ACP methyl ester carboxylesterase
VALAVDTVRSGGTALTVGSTAVDPGRPTLLFVNAVGMEAPLLDGVAAHVEDAGLNFLTWELRGSPGPADTGGPGDFSVEAHAADGVAVLDAFGVDDAVVAGWCTGATIGLFLAAELGPRATAFASIDGAFLFEGAPGGSVGNSVYAMCAAIDADEALAPEYHHLLTLRGGDTTIPGLDADPALIRRLTAPYRTGDGLLRFARATRGACAYDPAAVLATLACPTWFAARVDDTMVSYRRSETAAGLARDARLVVYPSGGHWALFTERQVLDDLTAFATSVVGARR